jgi:hypothetical protein
MVSDLLRQTAAGFAFGGPVGGASLIVSAG